MIKKIFKREYPFNYYGWTDFLWKNFYVPSYKRKLFKRFKKYDYCNFDIVDSIVEFNFEMFCDWFETSAKRYTELEPFNINENLGWVPVKEIKKVYQYITKYRQKNKEVVERLKTSLFDAHEIHWKEIKSFNNYYVDLEVFYNEDKKIISIIKTKKIYKDQISKEEGEKINKNSSNVIWKAEQKMTEWDSEILNFIVKNRERFWI